MKNLSPLDPDYQKVLEVWRKGHISLVHDMNLWRRDDFGNMIYFHAYGDRSSEWGWEIDHIVADALGGSDQISNLRPLHWHSNATLGGLLAKALRGRR